MAKTTNNVRTGPEQNSEAIQVQTNRWVLMCRSTDGSAVKQDGPTMKMSGYKLC